MIFQGSAVSKSGNLGEYYICYEIFKNDNSKHIFIGYFRDSSLMGILSCSKFSKLYIDPKPPNHWMLYNTNAGFFNKSPQLVFKLTEEEVIRHVVLETI